MGIIINADDYGLNEHCSKAIAQAFREGLVTDATIMATGTYFDEAVTLAKEEGFDDNIGIHLNLTEGVPLTEGIQSCDAFVENGRFFHRDNRIRLLTEEEERLVYRELCAQIEKVQDAGIRITHADSHHYIYTRSMIAPIAIQACREHGIDKMRIARNFGNIPLFERFRNGVFNDWLHSQHIKTVRYFGPLRGLDESSVIFDNTEILVHPDYDRDGVLIDRRSTENGVPVGVKLPDLCQIHRRKPMRYAAIYQKS